MENKLTETGAAALTAEQQEAYALHSQIMASGNLAAQALVEMCRCLKRMRDGKLYAALGYDTFEDYVTQAVGIGQRQAYTYISTYERLGDTVLAANASLGISKLEQFALIPPTERDKAAGENDLAGMSVREVKELVEKYNKAGEQISFLQSTAEEKDDKIRESQATAEALRDLAEKERRQRERLEKELEELKGRPVEVAVREPDEKELARIKKEAAAEAQAKWEAGMQKKLEAARKEAADKAAKEKEQEYRERVDAILQEAGQAKETAQRLEKELQLAGSEDTVRFQLYFQQAQDCFGRMLETLDQLHSKDAGMERKLRAAALKYVDILKDAFGQKEG